METLARDIVAGRRPDIEFGSPCMKSLVEDVRKGRLPFDDFVKIIATHSEDKLSKVA